MKSANVQDHFANLTDPRRRDVIYPLLNVVVIAVCAVLTDAGRRAVLTAYERRMDSLVTHPLFGYRLSYRRLLEVQSRLLARAVLGELAEYPSFYTR
jgi:CRISPR-associated protein Cas1